MKPMKSTDGLDPILFVIFGGAGDLAWRKLIPALFDLSEDRSQPAQFAIIAVDRIKLGDEALRRRLHDGSINSPVSAKPRPPRGTSLLSTSNTSRVISRGSRLVLPSANSARSWKNSGGRKAAAFSTWPHRRACSAKFQNISARPDCRAIANGRGS